MRLRYTLILGLVFAVGSDLPVIEAQSPYRIIVSPKLSGHTLSREALAQIYLGRALRWGNGVPIVAVDLSGTSPVRVAFSQEVLGMSLDAVKSYWLQTVSSSGKRPPRTKPSDEEVIAFVATEPGGLGYVSAATSLPDTVREVTVR